MLAFFRKVKNSYAQNKSLKLQFELLKRSDNIVMNPRGPSE